MILFKRRRLEDLEVRRDKLATIKQRMLFLNAFDLLDACECSVCAVAVNDR